MQVATLIKQFCDIRDFMLRIRMQLRFGRLSRAPLQVLRLERTGSHAACDWIARSEDPWDKSLPSGIGERNASLQALEDAISIRELLFCALRDISTATIRVYRKCADGSRELIIVGNVTRSQKFLYRVHSHVMQAKLCGFQFSLNGGTLMAFEIDDAGGQARLSVQ
jgi:hypothetical protein